MKLVLIVIFSLTATTSYASFNRLWVGFKKKDVATTKFLNGLNSTFFRDTIVVGKGRGLTSYQPYVTKMNGDLPDELALVIYDTEERYRQIRATPEGEAYSALHWDYFEKETSKSTVSQSFNGRLDEDLAYELNSSPFNWQSGITHVAIYARSPDVSNVQLASAFNNLKLSKDVNNSILLVTPKWVIEYRSLKAASVYQKLPLKLLEHKQLPNRNLNSVKESVGFGQGVNFLF